MKVILKEYVYMHGVAGDIVEVADGFARNFLIPQGKAVKATTDAIERHEALLAEAAIRRQELNDQLVALADKINGTELVFGRRAERNNKLYGSVTTMDIAEKILEETGVDINRRRISERSLREIGEYDVPIRMGQDLAPVVKVVIVREEELDEFLARRAAGEDVSDLIETGDDVAEGAVDMAEDAVEAVGDAVESAGDVVEDAVDAVGDVIEDAVDTVEDAVTGDDTELEEA